MPELRLVVLALQDRLAYGSTYEAALSALFEGTGSSLTASSEPQRAVQVSTPGTAQPAGTDVHATISEAARALEDYQRLTAQGKLGEAGQKLEDLKRAIDKLNVR